MTQRQLDKILDADPFLNDGGLFLRTSERGEERKAIMARYRQDLRDSLDSCKLAALWLMTKTKTATINHGKNSYGMKHFMEHDAGFYVTNGAFIVGAMFAGFKIEAFRSGSADAAFNISQTAFPKSFTGHIGMKKAEIRKRFLESRLGLGFDSFIHKQLKKLPSGD